MAIGRNHAFFTCPATRWQHIDTLYYLLSEYLVTDFELIELNDPNGSFLGTRHDVSFIGNSSPIRFSLYKCVSFDLIKFRFFSDLKVKEVFAALGENIQFFGQIPLLTLKEINTGIHLPDMIVVHRLHVVLSIIDKTNWTVPGANSCTAATPLILDLIFDDEIKFFYILDWAIATQKPKTCLTAG